MIKRFVVLNKNEQKPMGVFNTIEEANDFLLDVVENSIGYIISDFTIEMGNDYIIIDDINNYETADSYLKNDMDRMDIMLASSYSESLIKLLTIAKAWNKIDGFDPGIVEMAGLERFYPTFEYDRKTDKYLPTGVDYSSCYSSSFFGFNLCFRSPGIAAKFGEKFIEYWNIYLHYL
jgi:hypothetical protein